MDESINRWINTNRYQLKDLLIKRSMDAQGTNDSSVFHDLVDSLAVYKS